MSDRKSNIFFITPTHSGKTRETIDLIKTLEDGITIIYCCRNVSIAKKPDLCDDVIEKVLSYV